MNIIFIYFNSLCKAIVLILIIILISLPILYTIRWWAYNSAFEGMSKTRRKKILKAQSQINKHTLLFLLKFKNCKKTRLNIIFYYVYVFIQVIFMILLILRVNVVQWFFIGKLLLDVTVGLVFLKQTNPKK